MSKEPCYWTDGKTNGELGFSYCTLKLIDPNTGMQALRAMFPDATADPLNYVLFSTSGVHGAYYLIEDVHHSWCRGHRDEDAKRYVTFVIVQPRIVVMRYGNCTPNSEDDFAFLKRLRASSVRAQISAAKMAGGSI